MTQIESLGLGHTAFIDNTLPGYEAEFKGNLVLKYWLGPDPVPNSEAENEYFYQRRVTYFEKIDGENFGN